MAQTVSVTTELYPGSVYIVVGIVIRLVTETTVVLGGFADQTVLGMVDQKVCVNVCTGKSGSVNTVVGMTAKLVAVTTVQLGGFVE